MSPHEPRPRYIPISAYAAGGSGAVRVVAAASDRPRSARGGRSDPACAATAPWWPSPLPTNSPPITAATAPHSTTVAIDTRSEARLVRFRTDPPCGLLTRRAMYPLETPVSIGDARKFGRRSGGARTQDLGKPETGRLRKHLLEVLRGFLVVVQGFGNLDQHAVGVLRVDERLPPVRVVEAHHDQLDPAPLHPLHLRAQVVHLERDVVHALPPLVQEARDEPLPDGRDQLDLPPAREAVLHEPETLVVVVAEHEELSAQDVTEERGRLGGVVDGDRDVVELRAADERQDLAGHGAEAY